MIEIRNVSMSIDDKSILKNISFTCNEGRIVGLIGPNGAGKTTLINCLTGIYKPLEGNILYDGIDVFDNSKVKESIGYVQDENTFFSSFKIKDIKKYYKLAYKNFNEDKFLEMNKLFKIPLDKKIFQLSKGMKMRVNIMFALSIGAKYLILDEPTSGLDVIFKKKFFNLLKNEAKENNSTIILSSHHLNELENICDDIVIINNCEILYNDSLENLNSKVKKIQVAFNKPIYEEDFLEFKEVFAISKTGRVFTLITKDYNDIFIKKLNKLNPIFIEEINLTLEDMFIYQVEEGSIDEKYN
ncbi:ABC transporter ATP-binding protein [Clostridium sardiniense]|uniref:ABC transporter ATP-binding protein n=1 Tax=Clostridium sardiniense TaxID=29369 RepID=A0ABS7KXX1_CLOSR|nr:ABC transporter ATP-binding protein [Clostridium sardiniense]MBY0755668.1 ABC transporter ATP-binding protein [Clostridium sardiniense]MDQ0462156.1 ABC-2 type transport system ATP-binding protein [Clostridium sardiniense]